MSEWSMIRIPVEVFQRSPDEEEVAFCEDEPENEDDDDCCFSSSHMSESEGNVAIASASSGNADSVNANGEDVEVPPLCCWYHGQLDRQSAERLMIDAGLVPGSYLIRESDRRPRSYVLTLVSSAMSVVHFRINVVCGHYFISQHEFASLSDVVKHFSNNAVIGGCERLVNPVAPASPIELAKRKVITLVPFCAMKDVDELNFIKGDVLVVHEDFGNGWLWATSERTNDSGLVYSGLTQELVSCNRSPEKLLYVHSQISRQDAVALVAKEGVGGYIVTPSESSPGNYTLLVNCGRKVERFQIRQHDAGYEIGGRCFDGLHDIITRYSQVSICDDIKLVSPVAKYSPSLDNNNLYGDLYQKLRSNRLNSKNGRPDAIKCGYMNFKARKRWKMMFFLLKDTVGHLFCYENEKRTKPKIVLELFCCTLYLVHRSLFDRPYCFELIQSGFDVALYFHASSASEYEDWISLLRPLCCGNRQCPSPFSSVRKCPSMLDTNQLRKLNNLTIRIDKARNLSAKPNSELAAVISLNEAKVCRTCAVSCSDSVIWDEKFVFGNLPHEVSSITIAIRSRTKRSREVKLGCFKINVACDDASAFTCDDWFDIQSTGPPWRQTSAGQCHVKIGFCKEVVLPLDEYRSLADLIRDDEFALCHCLSSACSDDRQKLAEALLLYYEADVISLVISEIRREVEGSDDVRMLFRSGSLAVTFVDEMMLREGQDYAVAVLRAAVESLLSCKATLEIDQSKADKATSVASNVAILLNFTSNICDRIFDSVSTFPGILRCLLASVKENVSKKWSRDALIGLRAISSFVFLRLFCLILVMPRQYQLLPDTAPSCCYRNLLLVAKVLQSVANFSDVAAKRDADTVSEVLAAFSTRIRPRMIAFLSTISEPITENCDRLITSRRQSDPARHLATVFHICQKHLDAIRNQEKKYPAVKNLASVLELLDCHQKRYVGGPTVSVV